MKLFKAEAILPTHLKSIKLILLSCSFLFSSCSLFDRQEDIKTKTLKKANQNRVYYAKYENVWRALHQVIKYPIASENQDTGIIETEYVKAVDGFSPPEQQRPPSAGLRYKMTFNLIKGKLNQKESIKVSVDKRIEILRDFFSEPEILPTDGLEEKIIFYRIERELIIAEALKKASTTNP